MTTFQIVRISPTHCPSTDAVIGSRAHPLPMAYQIEAFAHRLAGRLGYQEYLDGGDDCFAVVPYGTSPFNRSRLHPVMPMPATELPF